MNKNPEPKKNNKINEDKMVSATPDQFMDNNELVCSFTLKCINNI